jgi:hypothetical protein
MSQPNELPNRTVEYSTRHKHLQNFLFCFFAIFLLLCLFILNTVCLCIRQICQRRLCTAHYAYFPYTDQGYDHCLDISSVICLTATKYKPFVRPVLSLALPNVKNNYIFIIQYFCCLQSFVMKSYYVWNFERQMQIAGRCAPWWITSDAENFVLQTLQFQKMAVRCDFPCGAGTGQYGPNQRSV